MRQVNSMDISIFIISMELTCLFILGLTPTELINALNIHEFIAYCVDIYKIFKLRFSKFY